MYKRILKYGKWLAIAYVAQALVGIAVGLYLVWNGSIAFGLNVVP
jgi:hypothetical protein